MRTESRPVSSAQEDFSQGTEACLMKVGWNQGPEIPFLPPAACPRGYAQTSSSMRVICGSEMCWLGVGDRLATNRE